MKTTLISSFLLMCVCIYAQTEVATLHVKLSPELSKVTQTVYWFNLRGNEYSILDSCLLFEKQKDFDMSASLIKNDFSNFSWLTFSKKGPLQMIVYPMAGEKMQVYIDNDTVHFPQIDGCIASTELYEKYNKVDEINKHIKKYEDSLIYASNPSLIEMYTDSLSHYLRYRSVGSNLDFLDKSKSPTNFYFTISILKQYLQPIQIDSLITVMKSRFPDNDIVQKYPENEFFPPASKQSKDIRNKFDDIAKKQLGYEVNNKQDKAASKPKKEMKIVPLKLGDKAHSFSLNNTKEEEISLKEINTPYILIDFWASWCGPCRVSFPQMRKVVEAFRDSLTIYAISLDSNKKAWKDAIRIDRTELFTHVLADEYNEITALFGVNSIPANFLLDKDRKIIAVNLSGEQLILKMKELQFQEDM